MVKYNFFPPSFVPGSALRAQVPTAAIPIAWTIAVRPAGVLTMSCALVESILIASLAFPERATPITSPVFKSSRIVNPAASPVIDGCGVVMRLILRLRVVRRRLTARVARRRVEGLRPRRARRQAFLLIPPACLIAHLGSLPRLATRSPILSALI